ncbi:uncharacterized protein LOC121695312 isoform X1 [Alosa sapidissima]|uniref:uncharacterized protein LOC121695312 isoform X1 n=2 Tax=Alosa sapidissima TaxID=34773 RepID=UPI001C08066C|nr:uncharacterized protein LOC121695312 isoform X1 [Alosa sapidissima]
MIDTMEEHPSQRETASRHSDGSSSGSAISSPQESRHLSHLQEYILNLTEEEWRAFSSMLQSPMTRSQFTELCMTILKVVSLSSITVILPAYVCVAKDAASTPTTLSDATSTERSPSSVLCRSSLATSPELLVTDADFTDESAASESTSSFSPEITGGPVSELVRRMKGALATLRKSVAWYPVISEVSDIDTDVTSSVSESSGHTEAHDLICITAILERLVASGNIHKVASNLVSQIQGVLQNSSPASISVAASKSLSDSVLTTKVKTVPKRVISASNLVYTYAEDAIKNLLQPYFLPLMEWNTNEDVASSTMFSSRIQSTLSGSYASGRPRSSQSADAATTEGPSTVPSLLGLDKADCSCLMTRLIQRLPANINYLETVESSQSHIATCDRGMSPSRTFNEVANLFTQVMTYQVMDIVDSELKRHDQASLSNKRPSSVRSSDEPRILSPDMDGTVTEGEISFLLDTSPGHSGGLFSGLIQRFLAEFRYSESALSDAGDDVRGAAVSSPRSQSTRSGTVSFEPDMAKDSKVASQKLKNMLGLFTSVMVRQVVDVLHKESTVEMDRETDQTKVVPTVEEQCSADEEPHGSTSRPSSSKASDRLTILLSDAITDGDEAVCDSGQKKSTGSPSTMAHMVGSDSSDNGCLVTVLMLRLLAKIKDQPTASADMMDSSQELIEKLLSEFSSTSGTPTFHTYPSNVKVQAIFRNMDKFLLKEFGPETVLQRAVETQEVFFDNVLLTALRKELLHQGGEATDPPATQNAPPSPQLVPVAEDGPTGSTKLKMPKMRFKMKMPKRSSKKVSPTNAFSDSTDKQSETPAPGMPCDEMNPSMSASGPKTRKRAFFLRIFTC